MRPSMHRHIDRRRLLQLSLAGGLSAALPPLGAAGAEDGGAAAASLLTSRPRPVVDARFPAEIAPGVFVLSDNRIPLVPNIVIVVGREQALVVDCGLGIESAEPVLNLTRRLAPRRRIVLTVTHAHPEHGFGAQVFKPDGRIYYNRLQRDYFLQSGTRLLEGFRAGVITPEARDVLDGIILVPPDAVYDGDRASLDLGGRRVEFRTWGIAHTPGDQIVHLPQDRILIAGDLIEERMFPIVPLFPPMITADEINIPQWETALTDILELRPRLVVPGHGGLAGPEVAHAVLGYFRAVRELVRTTEPSDQDLPMRVRASYPTWENPEFITPAIQHFLQRPS